MFRITGNNLSVSEMPADAETGSNRMLELIYAKYSPVIYGMICKTVSSETKASLLLEEIFEAALGKICNGEINVNNCFTCLLSLTRKHISEFLKSNHVPSNAIDESKNCIELIFVNGYSLEDIENKLNLSRTKARLLLREALNRLPRP